MLDSFWGEPQARCGNPCWPEHRPASWVAFVVLAGPTLGPWQFRENSLAPSDAKTARVAPEFFQTSPRQDGFHRTVHSLVSARSGQSLGGHDENIVANLSGFQRHGVWGLHRRLHPARVLFWEEMETSPSLVGPNGAIWDSCGDHSHRSRYYFPTHTIAICSTLVFQGATIKIQIDLCCGNRSRA